MEGTEVRVLSWSFDLLHCEVNVDVKAQKVQWTVVPLERGTGFGFDAETQRRLDVVVFSTSKAQCVEIFHQTFGGHRKGVPGVVWFLLFERTCRFLFSLEIALSRTIHHGVMFFENRYNMSCFSSQVSTWRHVCKNKDMNNM